MQISELIAVLERWKKQFGDADVVLTDRMTDSALSVSTVTWDLNKQRVNVNPSFWADERMQ